MKPFINEYNWERINFLSEKDDSKKIEKNNRTAALNILYSKNDKICPGYVLYYNSNREKQTLLMIPNR